MQGSDGLPISFACHSIGHASGAGEARKRSPSTNAIPSTCALCSVSPRFTLHFRAFVAWFLEKTSC